MDIDLRNNLLGCYVQCELPTSKLNERFRYSKPTAAWSPMDLELASIELVQQNEKSTWSLRVTRPMEYPKLPRTVNYVDYLSFVISKQTKNEHFIFYHAMLSDNDKKSVLASATGFTDSSSTIFSNVHFDVLKTFICDIGCLYIHLYLIDNFVSVDDLILLKPPASSGELDILQENYCCSFSKDLFDMFNSELLTDAVIIAKDKEFKIHKAIVGARSSRFATLFKTNSSNCIYLKDDRDQPINPRVANSFIKYAYTGAVDNIEQYVIELYELGHMYVMSALQSTCISYLKRVVNVDNTITILLLAKKYGIKRLYNPISTVFKTRAKEIFDSNSFNAFMSLISS
ncbi:uncharacterized protein LOC131667618 isoform X1 [Phymastichus coffea]|uniref:uncharacterized protein LOC131667618 isoform X1 n=1 Tax=Phymastichus coffea TaxID=108790 RepID=UPI00273B94AB|nr:uncharacterized protein LOC131667618 isoform X1 [Phymastichus coffea]XP_058797136.1 uncharacterized protein LOC131667618 isoform X1 [Phymastichus coffea]XP_058797137.1 uncharacterized protein LOC131667618 isoform X1 [Phymastichus coffea]